MVSERTQQWTYFDGLYFTVVALLTIGYGGESDPRAWGAVFLIETHRSPSIEQRWTLFFRPVVPARRTEPDDSDQQYGYHVLLPEYLDTRT